MRTPGAAFAAALSCLFGWVLARNAWEAVLMECFPWGVAEALSLVLSAGAGVLAFYFEKWSRKLCLMTLLAGPFLATVVLAHLALFFAGAEQGSVIVDLGWRAVVGVTTDDFSLAILASVALAALREWGL